MPHFPHTPEALLRRNDSKDANRTCRGITASGRACRRALAGAKSSPASQAIDDCSPLRSDDHRAFYCWQHQEQAEQNNAEAVKEGASNRRTKPGTDGLKTLRERSSIDTLVQKLGINGSETERPKKHTVPTRDTQRSKHSSQAAGEKNVVRNTARRNHKSRGFWATLCCIGSADEDGDYVEIVRHKRRVQQMQELDRPPVARASFSVPSQQAQVRQYRQQTGASANPQPNPPTSHLLSLIPPHLPPPIASSLLTELAKPISPYDEEGYIYIFWLTPQSKERPGDSTARALLSPPGARPHNNRRISDVMTEFSFQEQETSCNQQNKSGRRTIMLKIGRASNITRRMNEWQRQCGYALNLVRWYPHVPSSGSNASSPHPFPQHRASEPLYPDLSRPPTSRGQSETVQKCPHVHRVERLIHLELSAKQVRRRCHACGKEHREWFEVEATQAGVKAVDESIRRWVRWAEGQMK